MKLLNLAAPLGLAAATALIASGCGGSAAGYGGGHAAATTPAGGAQAAPGAVAVRPTKLGRVLVDGRGRTLYLFEADHGGRSTCSGACASIWPPLMKGHAQVVYAGHPLYLYAGDRKPGDTAGQGLDQFGAKWYVLGRSGRKIDDD